MSVFSEHDKRFEALAPRTAMFVTVATLIIVATIIASLVKHDAFTPTMRVLFLAQSAQGIHKGMSVQLSGFRIGSVHELGIEPDARVKVTLLIEKKYAAFIPQDSYAGLSKEGLIGTSFIEIEPGEEKILTIAEGSVLRFYRAGDFADMAQELKGKLDPILADVKRATQSINDPDGDIRKTVGNVQRATAHIAELAQQVNQQVKRNEGRVDAIAAKVDRVLDQSVKTLDRAYAASDTAARRFEIVDQQLPGLLLRLDESLKNIEAISADVRRVSSSLSEELPVAIREGRGLVEDTRQIVDGAKQSWPLQNMVPPGTQRALPVDSYDSAGNRGGR